MKTLLVSSRFAFDLTTSSLLVQSNLVFLNGYVVINPNLLVFVGDVLQIIIHLKYYIVHR